MVAELEFGLGSYSPGIPEIIYTNYFRPKDWHKRARDDLTKFIQYSIQNMSGYVIGFYRAAFFVVSITDDKMLEKFVSGLKPKIRE